MPRRSYNTAKPGQLYASEWPEWHVDCAADGCQVHALVAELGEAMTAKEALKIAKTAVELSGWKRIGGLWYCPQHAAK